MKTEEIIDRQTYKKIKAMNRTEMNAFLIDILTNNTESNEESSSRSTLLDELRSAISSVKGIGEVKLDAIMTVISEVLNGYDFNE